MTQRPASSDPIALGLIAGEVATAAAGGEVAPAWIKVTPRGEAKTRDGRRFHFDPDALVARFSADAIELAVDLDHGIALRASQGNRVDAVGYAAELQARPDGVYARVNWLDAGHAVLAARSHRYVSPTFHHDATGRATWLHSISLVTAPALSMPALAHAFGALLENPMKKIATALGLAEDATEDACVAALAARTAIKPLAAALGLPATADAAACLSAAAKAKGGLAPVAKKLGLAEAADEAACLTAIGALQAGAGPMVEQLQAQLSATSTQLAGVVKAARDKDVGELLEGALKDRKIVPAQREHLQALCATDEGFANVRAMLGATAPGLQPSNLGSRTADDGADAGDPATLSAKARKIQRDREEAGTPIGWSEAIALAFETKS